MLAQTQGPIIIVQDGARYHTAAQTRESVAEHSERLSVYQLPSYSPDYNPVEHLWRNVKHHKTHNRYFPSVELSGGTASAGAGTDGYLSGSDG